MGVFSRVLRLFRSSRAGRGIPARPGVGAASSPERASGVEELRMPWPRSLVLSFEPRPDGRPDGGEVVWAWVPYQEDPSQGKDRPLLVLARDAGDRVLAMKLTSRAPGRDGDHVALGSGPWDRSGRESWVDIDQLYRVPSGAIRREGASVDARTFARVAAVLADRHGWRERG